MSGSHHGSIQDLNVLPSAGDADVDAFSPDDLAIFTNTRFFDFDMGPETKQREARDVSHHEEDVEGDPLAEGELIDPNLKGGNMDFLNDYDLFGYGSFSLNDIPHTSTDLHDHTPTATTPNIALGVDTNFTDVSNSMIAPHGSSYNPPPAPLSDSASPTPFPITPTSSSRGMRVRKASTASSSEHPIQSPSPGDNFGFGGDGSESGSRTGAADEDKRRRNTAASARFRVKKKQREQDLEKRSKEGEEKVKELESRIKQLQTENTWLKDLLMEKNTSKESAAPSSKQKAGAKDGVGTKEKKRDSNERT